MARAILGEFPTLHEALSAGALALNRSAGPHAAHMLHTARALMLSALEQPLYDRPLVPVGNDLTAFLQLLLGYRPREALIALHVDQKYRLICFEEIATGTTDAVEFDYCKILLRALERGAAGIILVHNHPSGDAQPSTADLRATRKLADLARAFSVALHDHVIVAHGRARSVI